MNKERIIRGLLAVGLLLWSSSMRAQTNPTNSQAPLYISMQFSNWPPLPGNPLNVQSYWLSNRVDGVPVYAYDDRDINYAELAAKNASELESIQSYGSGSESASYGPSDLWLAIISLDITHSNAVLRLHGTVETNSYQLSSTPNLLTPFSRWIPGEIKTGAANTNQTDFTNAIGNSTQMFFRAHQASLVVSVERVQDTIEGSLDPGIFQINVPGNDNLTVYYRLGGDAQNGVDYTNIPLQVEITGGAAIALIDVFAIEDVLPELDETVTLTLLQTNTYLIDPSRASATITISDAHIFDPVVTNLDTPVGIDFHAPSNSLVVSFNQGNHGFPINFALIDSNGVIMTNWSGISGLDDEVKVALVRTGGSLTNAGGFTNADMYFGTGQDGIVGSLSADGTIFNPAWSVLSTNGDNQTLLRGGLYVDQTGVWNNDLIVVTGNGPDQGGGVWRINSARQGTRVANITNNINPHLEGVVTLTNDPAKWGPWAGKIITGAESALDEDLNFKPLIHAIDTNGVVRTFTMGIAPEDFDVILTNQDLYCVDYQGQSSTILKLSRNYLTNYIGDLLITQSGDGGHGATAKLFFVHWDSTNEDFVVRSISLPLIFAGEFENVTFAPISLPALPFP